MRQSHQLRPEMPADSALITVTQSECIICLSLLHDHHSLLHYLIHILAGQEIIVVCKWAPGLPDVEQFFEILRCEC